MHLDKDGYFDRLSYNTNFNISRNKFISFTDNSDGNWTFPIRKNVANIHRYLAYVNTVNSY